MAKPKWTPDAVITAIRTLKRQKHPLRFKHIPPHLAGLYLEACKQFGSWNGAVHAAGLRAYGDTGEVKPRAKKWTREFIVATIKKLHADHQPLNSIAVGQTSVYRSAYKEFGGWRQAITAAGIDYDSVRLTASDGGYGKGRTWNKTSVVAAILQRHSQGLSVAATVVDKADSGLRFAARQHFGHWTTALIAAGLVSADVQPRTKRPNGYWTKSRVVEIIQQRHRDGLPLSSGILQRVKETIRLRAAGEYVFGSWQAALIAAGLDPATIYVGTPNRNIWTDEKVVQIIKSLAASNAQLNHKSVDKNDPRLTSAARRKFGNWATAVTAAGLDYSTIRQISGPKGARQWSSELVVEGIRALAARFVSLNSGTIIKKDVGLYQAGKKRFGTWARAVVAAGFDYSKYEYHREAHPVTRVALPRNWVSLDEPLNGNTETTREAFLGAVDPGFMQVEARQMLQALLDKRKLASDMATLVKRLILGEDLEDSEYEALASAIRKHPELMKLLETT